MDEALTRVAIDISGRPFLVFKAEFVRDKVGEFDTELVQEWFQAFAMNAGVTLHAETLYGSNDHHIAELLLQGPGPCVAYGRGHRSARQGRSTLYEGFALAVNAAILPDLVVMDVLLSGGAMAYMRIGTGHA